MTRDQIAGLLGMGPSGARKYVADLNGLTSLTFVGAEQFHRWTANANKTRAFMASLDALAARPMRAPRTALSIATRDPSRHFHILADDEHFSVRVSRCAPARDPMALPVAFFGQAQTEQRA
jgi:hypothetical protein